MWRTVLKRFAGFKKFEDVHSKRAEIFDDVDRNNQNFIYQFDPDYYEQQLIELDNMELKHLPDNNNFFKIPQLCHNLQEHMNGQLYQGDKGLSQYLFQISKNFPEEFTSYIKPSQDEKLLKLVQEHKCKYYSSTSNLSGILAHLYYIFTCFRRPNMNNLFEGTDEPKNNDEGIFFPEHKVLMNSGNYIEYLLTKPIDTIKADLMSKNPKKDQNYYRYAVANNQILIRSQIDCKGKDQLGNDIVFQIKSRAVAPIRYDVQNYQDYLDYPILSKRGLLQSFQRQYYDLVRGGFIKYGFQLKIGQMDGAFIAFHNTQKIFGYQYVKIKQIALRIFGNQYNFDLAFVVMNKLLTTILNAIVEDFKEYNWDQLKIGFYAKDTKRSLIVFIEVMDQDKTYKKVDLHDVNKNILTYFKKIQPLRNPVYKYQFTFFIFQNDSIIRSPETYFSPNDDIKIRWKKKKLCRAAETDYFSFLYSAYKLDSNNCQIRYTGAWKKYQENDD